MTEKHTVWCELRLGAGDDRCSGTALGGVCKKCGAAICSREELCTECFAARWYAMSPSWRRNRRYKAARSRAIFDDLEGHTRGVRADDLTPEGDAS